ncbi:hypothetical protein OROHE_006667 [Orobanche hederae]
MTSSSFSFILPLPPTVAAGNFVFATSDIAVGDDYLASIDEYFARNCPEPLTVYDEARKARQLKKLICLVDTVVDANDGVSYTIELIVDYPDLFGNGSNKVYAEEQMSGFLEKIESRLRESALMLEKKLAEKCIARMQAEAMALEARTKLLHEMSGLRLYLEKACSFFGWPDFCLFRQAGLRLFLSPLLRFCRSFLSCCRLAVVSLAGPISACSGKQDRGFFVFAAQIAVSLDGLLVQAIRIAAVFVFAAHILQGFSYFSW